MKKKDTALAGALLLVLAGWSAADAAEIYTLDPARHCHGGTYRYERIKNAGSGGDYHG